MSAIHSFESLGQTTLGQNKSSTGGISFLGEFMLLSATHCNSTNFPSSSLIDTLVLENFRNPRLLSMFKQQNKGYFSSNLFFEKCRPQINFRAADTP